MSKRLLVEQKHTKAGIEFIKEGLEEFGIEGAVIQKHTGFPGVDTVKKELMKALEK